jgi:glycosyltransferase involved in cell wall biosynthesis
MKVLHIHDQITNKGGTEVYLADLQKYLPAYGHTSYWLGIQTKDDLYVVSEYQGRSVEMAVQGIFNHLEEWVNSKEIDLICIHNLFDVDLSRFLVSLRPTIKFSHSPVLVCPGRDKYWRFSQKPCTIPYGVHCFWHIYTEGCSNRHPKRILKAWNYVKDELARARNGYKKVIVMSKYNRERLLECEVPPDKITVNPYFTSYAETVSNADETQDLRFLFIGRIISGKGVPEMLNAVEPILKKHSHVKLDIIGDGLQMADARKMVAEKHIEDKVLFHGWLPKEEINKFLANCYLVIFPSIYPESFGIVGIESMMYAKPVVAFDVGGVSTWLEDGETGYLVPSGNTALMSDAVERLLTDKAGYKKMSETARTHAMEKFSQDVHLKKLTQVFEEAMV